MVAGAARPGEGGAAGALDVGVWGMVGAAVAGCGRAGTGSTAVGCETLCRAGLRTRTVLVGASPLAADSGTPARPMCCPASKLADHATAAVHTMPRSAPTDHRTP